MDRAQRTPPAPLARVVRDGFVESVHTGHVAVVDLRGRVLAAIGDPHVETYPRSSLKPFQVAAVLDLLAPGGPRIDLPAIAVASASHAGSVDQQTEAARLLALAGLDEDALQCPPAFPADIAALRATHAPDRLSHNCSGKHAAFLLAQVATAEDPARYRDAASTVQRRVATTLAAVTGARPAGPGVDGCGAPAWRLPLAALALAFARLAAREGAGERLDGTLADVAGAMSSRPDLVGGPDAHDTLLMLADARVVAKRGAEAVLAAGFAGEQPFGVAVKVADGGARAAAPVVATVLDDLGAHVPEGLTAPPVLGGERVHGVLEVDAAVARAGAAARAARTA